jgi:tRNA pseudouridine38-40 synthase
MISVRTLKLTIAYDGTNFAGWQRQATERTVQAAIEDALRPIEGERVAVTGAGRTDAGVHAAGQVASFKLTSGIGAIELQRALNATLPDDVRILDVEERSPEFNARFDARHKTYHYLLWSGGILPPSVRHHVWHVPQPLDVPTMNAAAEILVGTHDFAAFQAAGSDVQTTVRELLVSRVSRLAPGPTVASDDRLIRYEVTGTGFLRHMVRNIVGTLVDAGRGRLTLEDVRAILGSRDRGRASATAPSHGLTLWSVEYKTDAETARSTTNAESSSETA